MTDEEIEQVARGICTALGLDPDERMGCGIHDDETPGEREIRCGGSDLSFEVAVLVYKPRWRLFRRKAAEALAAKAALAKL